MAAGLDKLTDPQFFDAQSLGYIGKQLGGFAQQSPIGSFLTEVAVPNATIFGAMVLAGELAIGLGTLVGLFSRTAAIFGFILSMTLWLTASWAVTPFFLGSDLPYAMGWLTLALAGGHPVWSLDGLLRRYVFGRTVAATPNAPGMSQPQPPLPGTVDRRRFIGVVGATVLAGAVTGVAWLHSLQDKSEAASAGSSSNTSTTPATTNQTTPAAQTGTAANGVASSTNGKVVGTLASLAVGNAQKFTTPDTNEKGILIRQQDGSVTAFSTICTHEGCEVGFDKSQQVLACPCHGAQYDIKTGAATRRPAINGLKTLSVSVENGNIVYSQS